jgi:hypothetical protein
MRTSRHPARRDLHGRLGAEYARASMPFLIAVSIVALILIFLPTVMTLLPALIFGER